MEFHTDDATKRVLNVLDNDKTKADVANKLRDMLASNDDELQEQARAFISSAKEAANGGVIERKEVLLAMRMHFYGSVMGNISSLVTN